MCNAHPRGKRNRRGTSPCRGTKISEGGRKERKPGGGNARWKSVSRPAGTRWRRFGFRSRSRATTCHQLRHFDERTSISPEKEEETKEGKERSDERSRPRARREKREGRAPIADRTVAGENASVGASRAMPGDPRRVKEVRRPLTGGEQRQRQRVLRAPNTRRFRVRAT